MIDFVFQDLLFYLHLIDNIEDTSSHHKISKIIIIFEDAFAQQFPKCFCHPSIKRCCWMPTSFPAYPFCTAEKLAVHRVYAREAVVICNFLTCVSGVAIYGCCSAVLADGQEALHDNEFCARRMIHQLLDDAPVIAEKCVRILCVIVCNVLDRALGDIGRVVDA